jgi:hypothetical protein
MTLRLNCVLESMVMHSLEASRRASPSSFGHSLVYGCLQFICVVVANRCLWVYTWSISLHGYWPGFACSVYGTELSNKTGWL